MDRNKPPHSNAKGRKGGDSRTSKGKPTLLDLHIPEQVPPPEDSFLLKPREVKRWVANLPTANIGETARQVYKTLVTFNRIEVPPIIRAEVIEMFREPVRYINLNMTKHYVDVGFPLQQKARKASQLAIELCNEVAISYKSVVQNMLQGSDDKFDQNLLIVAIHRALQYLGQSMFHTFLVYTDRPVGLWREIHALYAYAAQNHVQQIPVKETSKRRWKQKTRSIEDLYKGYLLLETTAPQRLRQSQIRRIHNQIPEWSKLTSMKEVGELSYSTGVFYVNLWSDKPPQKSLSSSEKSDSRFRAFDLNDILAKARTDFDQTDWESPVNVEKGDDEFSRSLLRLLIRGWNKSLERKFARTQLSVELQVTVGIPNLYSILEHDRQEAAQAAGNTPGLTGQQRGGNLAWNDSVFSTLAIATPAKSTAGDSIFSDSLAVASTLLGDDKSASWAQPEPQTTTELFSVLTYNESAEGYCLHWQGKRPPKIRVGDLLGIRSEVNPREYGLGIVRWLRNTEQDDLYLGIQVISSHVTAATVVPSEKATHSKRNQHRCLLLTGDGIDKDQLGLIVNTKEFPVGSIITLITEFGEHQIRLTEWMESSTSFIHYQFDYLDHGRAKKQESVDKDSNFDELWDDL